MITKDVDNNSFEVQTYDNLDGASRNYKNIELYLLPLALFSLQPLDTIDQRYVSSTHAPISNPLQKSIQSVVAGLVPLSPRLCFERHRIRGQDALPSNLHTNALLRSPFDFESISPCIFEIASVNDSTIVARIFLLMRHQSICAVYKDCKTSYEIRHQTVAQVGGH